MTSVPEKSTRHIFKDLYYLRLSHILSLKRLLPELGCQNCISFVSSGSSPADSLTYWWCFWYPDLHSGRISLWTATEQETNELDWALQGCFSAFLFLFFKGSQLQQSLKLFKHHTINAKNKRTLFIELILICGKKLARGFCCAFHT